MEFLGFRPSIKFFLFKWDSSIYFLKISTFLYYKHSEKRVWIHLIHPPVSAPVRDGPLDFWGGGWAIFVVQEFFFVLCSGAGIFFYMWFACRIFFSRVIYLQIFNTLDCLDILIWTVKAAQMYTMSSIYCFYIICRSEKTLRDKGVALCTKDFNMLYVHFGKMEEE